MLWLRVKIYNFEILWKIHLFFLCYEQLCIGPLDLGGFYKRKSAGLYGVVAASYEAGGSELWQYLHSNKPSNILL